MTSVRDRARRAEHVDALLTDDRLSATDREIIGLIGHRIEGVFYVHDRAYFYLYEPRCSTCRSPYRCEIERLFRANSFKIPRGQHLPQLNVGSTRVHGHEKVPAGGQMRSPLVAR